MAKSAIFNQMRRALPEGLRSIIDSVEDHPVVAEVVECASRAYVAERIKVCDKLSALDAPALQKRIAAAGEACNAATAAASAALMAHRAAQAALLQAQGAAYGLQRQREGEIDRLQRLLRAGATPVVRDALWVMRDYSLNFHLPDLNSGVRVADNRGVPAGFGYSPEQEDALGLADWHAAVAVQRQVIAALEVLELQAISEADAAEAVTVHLRRFTSAARKIKAPGFEVGPDGSIVRIQPGSSERETLTLKPLEVQS
jgi:hypothetical protein